MTATLLVTLLLFAAPAPKPPGLDKGASNPYGNGVGHVPGDRSALARTAYCMTSHTSEKEEDHGWYLRRQRALFMGHSRVR